MSVREIKDALHSLAIQVIVFGGAGPWRACVNVMNI